jgi:arsenate reductase
MNRLPCRVLFLCTGNSARSILAEALLNHLGAPQFEAYSAGSQPTGRVHPLALAVLTEHQVPVGKARSKRWEEFAQADGSTRGMEIIITVCDNAAGEVCPVWPGEPVTAHWGIKDPASVSGDEAVKRLTFQDAFETLHEKVHALVTLPIEQLDRPTLKKQLDELGARRIAARAP